MNLEHDTSMMATEVADELLVGATLNEHGRLEMTRAEFMRKLRVAYIVGSTDGVCFASREHRTRLWKLALRAPTVRQAG